MIDLLLFVANRDASVVNIVDKRLKKSIKIRWKKIIEFNRRSYEIWSTIGMCDFNSEIVHCLYCVLLILIKCPRRKQKENDDVTSQRSIVRLFGWMNDWEKLSTKRTKRDKSSTVKWRKRIVWDLFAFDFSSFLRWARKKMFDEEKKRNYMNRTRNCLFTCCFLFSSSPSSSSFSSSLTNITTYQDIQNR